MEYNQLHRAIEMDRAVLGICRGYQLINVYFGGTIYRDISHIVGSIRYSIFAWKNINLEEGSALYSTIKSNTIKINTLHHQAIKSVAHSFSASSRDRYGVVQSIESDDGAKISGVQWHPEYIFFYSRKNFKIFKDFIKICS